MEIKDLKVGQFAEKNKTILYRNRISKLYDGFAYSPGIYYVEKHPSLPLYDGKLDNYNPVTNPHRKHINNAIKMLKDDFKLNNIDNLSYIENLEILKNYLKPVIVKTEK